MERGLQWWRWISRIQEAAPNSGLSCVYCCAVSNSLMAGRWHQGELRSLSAQGYHSVWGELMSQIIISPHHHGCCQQIQPGVSHWSLEESTHTAGYGPFTAWDGGFREEAGLQLTLVNTRCCWRLMDTQLRSRMSSQTKNFTAERSKQTLLRFGMYWHNCVPARKCRVRKWSIERLGRFLKTLINV